MIGKLLRINLTTEESREEEIAPEQWESFIGGRGLGAYYLTKEVKPDIDPFSEEH